MYVCKFIIAVNGIYTESESEQRPNGHAQKSIVRSQVKVPNTCL